MKFVVTKYPLNVTEITLPWETKDKIRKILVFGTLAIGVGAYTYRRTPSKTPPTE